MESQPGCGPGLKLKATTVCLAIAALVGCAGSAMPTAPVSGKVTLDGKPLANVSVLFQPVGGANRDPGVGSYGITDAQGNYTLNLSSTDKAGAVIGQHAVTLVDKSDPAADQDAGGIDQPVVTRIPEEYSNGSQRFEVKSGSANRANFELKSPATP